MKISIKEAITEIKESGLYGNQVHQVHQETLELALVALEKQIPKEPVTLKSMSVYRCPVCKCDAQSELEDYGYCQHCGQALKWEG